MLIAILPLFAVAWAEEPWFYLDETETRAVIDADGRLGGLPVRATGRVVIAADRADREIDHPDVIRAEWLTHHPAVARLHLRPGADDFAVSRALRARPEILWSNPDLAFTPELASLPDDPMVAEQWHLENDGQRGAPGVDVNAEAAWAYTNGAGQLIAILDSGVDPAHEDLITHVGWDYLDGDADSTPAGDEAHGTACAGLAAATGDNGLGVAGVAWGAEVYGIRLIGGSISYSDIYDAFIESVDAGASVISNSWGSGVGCAGYSLSSTLRQAFKYAEEEGRGGLGTAVVFATGNDYCDASQDGILGYKTIIGVGAVDANDEREDYSNYGEIVDIVAPSGGVLTTDISGDAGYGSYDGDSDYYDGMSGTSASTPIVAGALALMFAANDRLTVEQARTILCETATRNDVADGEYDETGWSPWYGCGRLDAGAAVAAVANGAPGAPTPAMDVAEVYADRIWLDWTAADDPDGDALTYTLQWWTNDRPAINEVVTGGLSYELVDPIWVGEEITWQVQAADRWGAGPWSEPHTVTVIDRPEPAPTPEEPAGTCASAPALAGVWWLSLLALARRRS